MWGSIRLGGGPTQSGQTRYLPTGSAKVAHSPDPLAVRHDTRDK